MSQITVKIDGREVEVEEGITILEACESAGAYVPALCHYPGLKPLAESKPDRACQLCVVEVEGAAEPQLACITPVADRMVVYTNSAALQRPRRRSLTQVLSRYPGECVVEGANARSSPSDLCPDGSGDLQKIIDHIGLDELRAYIPKKLPVREDSPFFIRENNLC
ncbi:MAG: 2Fe-2S iron-sulfur cluster-binding protein, partial [Chloroflexota bacterium]